LGGVVAASAGGEQLGGAQDEQRGRDVAGLEGADRAEQSAEFAA
jgi:hypothetical protein